MLRYYYVLLLRRYDETISLLQNSFKNLKRRNGRINMPVVNDPQHLRKKIALLERLEIGLDLNFKWYIRYVLLISHSRK